MIRDAMVEIINDDDKDYHIVRQIMSYDPCLTYGEYIIIKVVEGNYSNGLICDVIFRSGNYRKIEDKYNKIINEKNQNGLDAT